MKLCIDCKWCDPNTEAVFTKCLNTKINMPSPVDGKPRSPYCDRLRADRLFTRNCGSSGRYWEAKGEVMP